MGPGVDADALCRRMVSRARTVAEAHRLLAELLGRGRPVDRQRAILSTALRHLEKALVDVPEHTEALARCRGEADVAEAKDVMLLAPAERMRASWWLRWAEQLTEVAS